MKNTISGLIILTIMLGIAQKSSGKLIQPKPLRFTAEVVCSGQQKNRTVYVVQLHLVAKKNIRIIMPDSLSFMEAKFINTFGDTTNSFYLGELSPIIGYYKIGTLGVPCPDGTYPRDELIHGREYRFHYSIPVSDSLDVQKIRFGLQLRIQSTNGQILITKVSEEIKIY